MSGSHANDRVVYVITVRWQHGWSDQSSLTHVSYSSDDHWWNALLIFHMISDRWLCVCWCHVLPWMW
jgi:hypothetical protein